ncbi:penicillin acylase family protein [Kordiimonas aquimaris]|uniref:penicillin acylase family protein n=1 Tax=Kordiimonas aquimaris TaxID=707591 RepID=UPI0021D21528|nr:penicillin acylase family protein [Kordiimonas aquimaris]
MFNIKSSVVVLSMMLWGCGQVEEQTLPKYEAEVTYTEYGIPHIVAENNGSLGFGEGYVAASDHLCNISHIIIRANGELSRYLGVGEGNQNFISDYAVRGLGMLERYTSGYEKQSIALKETMEGYASGFNKYLSEYQGTENKDHWCDGADWVKPVTALDVFARARYISETLPRLGRALYASKPPSIDTQTGSLDDTILKASIDALGSGGFGSNAWAIGADHSETGGGMLLANPHYPWFGSNRFWEKHLTIPGEVDMYGVTLLGMPGVAIGFNKDIAWSHTVSNSQRVVVYQLTLSPDDPMSYIYEGEVKPLEKNEFSVPVKGEDGQIQDQSATMYFSHHGPVVTLPGMEWSDAVAFAMRDANRDNDYTIAQWNDMGRANSMDAFKAAHEKWNAIPWINTIATSRDGQAVYLDNSTVGNLSDTAIENWKNAYNAGGAVKQAYDRSRLTVLDGSSQENDFVVGNAPLPGTVPFNERPQITRSDYVFNSNDSYWLSSPREPMTGHSPLYGAVETERSLRTRMNILHLEDENAKGEDGKWSVAEIQETILSNQSLSASLLLPHVIAICIENEMAIDQSACEVLKSYDGHLNTDSVGSVLFREWLFAYRMHTGKAGKPMFAEGFSKDFPVETPNGLNDPALALAALETALSVLSEASVNPDVALGGVQVAVRGEETIPMHGGFSLEGVANLIDQRPNDTIGPFPTSSRYETRSGLSDKGYLVSGGTSFIMTLAYGDDGPEAEAFLTYGQSGTPNNEHYSDQTKLFSEKKWRKIRFTSADVEANKVRKFTVSGE